MTDFRDYRVRDARRFVENLEDELRHVPSGQPLPVLDAIEGADASGTVYCMIRLDGSPSRVVITDGWWDSVGPHGIADAVLQAYRYAGEKASLAKMVLHRNGRPWRTGKEAAAEPRPGLRFPAGRSTLDDIDRIRRSLEETADRIDRSMRLHESAAGSVQHEVSGPRRMFTVVLRGPAIEGARVDASRLRPHDGSDLGMDAADALLAARPDHRRLREG